MPGFQATKFCSSLCIDGMNQSLREFEAQHLFDFMLTLLIPTQLRHATPLVIKLNR
ncbi:hypothetical protein D3C75_700380 [compost metagenome]